MARSSGGANRKFARRLLWVKSGHCSANRHVRFTPESGDMLRCTLADNRGARQKDRPVAVYPKSHQVIRR